MKSVYTSNEYMAIAKYYSDRTAKRSKVPLINHINDGLIILEAINASRDAMLAYCLHPLLQDDESLAQNFDDVSSTAFAKTVALALEYRSVANEFLSARIDEPVIQQALAESGIVKAAALIRLSPLRDVNDMLIADKVQNRKDFVTYHKATHARSIEIDIYFKMWLARLNVSSQQYTDLCTLIDLHNGVQKIEVCV